MASTTGRRLQSSDAALGLLTSTELGGSTPSALRSSAIRNRIGRQDRTRPITGLTPCMPYAARSRACRCSQPLPLVKAESGLPAGYCCCPLLSPGSCSRYAPRAPLGYESFDRCSRRYSADPKISPLLGHWGSTNGQPSQSVPAGVCTSGEQAVSIRLQLNRCGRARWSRQTSGCYPFSQPQPSPSRSRSNGSGGRTRIGPSTYSGPLPVPPAQS
jgi:hypothetical protein